MISHPHKCIFVHIPKCGGSSIEDVIWPVSERTEANLWMGFVESMQNKYQTGGLQHLLARQIRQEVGHETFANYFKFAFVRNPWDRAASQFSYTMQSRPDLRQFASIGENASFEEYLDRIGRTKHVQWEKQVEFVHDETGQLLVDYVGRFESFERDVRDVLSRLGITTASIPHANRSDRARFPKYTTEARDRITEMYKADIAAFGYSCPWPL
jgi:hypothetical protein